jgi:hypothetical protein
MLVLHLTQADPTDCWSESVMHVGRSGSLPISGWLDSNGPLRQAVEQLTAVG